MSIRRCGLKLKWYVCSASRLHAKANRSPTKYDVVINSPERNQVVAKDMCFHGSIKLLPSGYSYWDMTLEHFNGNHFGSLRLKALDVSEFGGVLGVWSDIESDQLNERLVGPMWFTRQSSPIEPL